MSEPLTIYLSDHYTGAVAGVELARRLARTHRGRPDGGRLDVVAQEVAADRETLRALMAELGIRPALYRRVGAWLAEKAARFKLNGRLLRRSPLSSVVELEAMLTAVEGKAAGWRLLRALAEHDHRFSPEQLDHLEQRARRQAETLEELRRAAGLEVLTQPSRATH